jgi:4a-hydroxytetrahydrobiopterin dehydratase
MITFLDEVKCVPCHRDAPRITDEELARLKPQIPDWAIVEEAEVPRLLRVFQFSDFAHALNFTNQIGAMAEQEGHHPALLTEWGKVTVSWWTHKLQGLHINDLVMAARTDQVFQDISAYQPAD